LKPGHINAQSTSDQRLPTETCSSSTNRRDEHLLDEFRAETFGLVKYFHNLKMDAIAINQVMEEMLAMSNRSRKEMYSQISTLENHEFIDFASRINENRTKLIDSYLRTILEAVNETSTTIQDIRRYEINLNMLPVLLQLTEEEGERFNISVEAIQHDIQSVKLMIEERKEFDNMTRNISDLLSQVLQTFIDDTEQQMEHGFREIRLLLLNVGLSLQENSEIMVDNVTDKTVNRIRGVVELALISISTYLIEQRREVEQFNLNQSDVMTENNAALGSTIKNSTIELEYILRSTIETLTHTVMMHMTSVTTEARPLLLAVKEQQEMQFVLLSNMSHFSQDTDLQSQREQQIQKHLTENTTVLIRQVLQLTEHNQKMQTSLMQHVEYEGQRQLNLTNERSAAVQRELTSLFERFVQDMQMNSVNQTQHRDQIRSEQRIEQQQQSEQLFIHQLNQSLVLQEIQQLQVNQAQEFIQYLSSSQNNLLEQFQELSKQQMAHTQQALNETLIQVSEMQELKEVIERQRQQFGLEFENTKMFQHNQSRDLQTVLDQLDIIELIDTNLTLKLNELSDIQVKEAQLTRQGVEQYYCTRIIHDIFYKLISYTQTEQMLWKRFY